MKETIYVLMPAYNVEKYIANAFDSLIGQTYTDWVCLCVNDGSTDNTQKIMEKYARLDKRIKIFQQKNKGVTRTLNMLLDRTKGPYLAYLDADDAIHPQMLEQLLTALKKNNADVAECTEQRFSNIMPDDFHKKIPDIETELLTEMNIFLSYKTSRGSWKNKWNKVYRWDKVRDIRFSEDLVFEEDHFYCSIIDSSIKRKVLVPYPFYYYRQNPTSLNGKIDWECYQNSGINRIRLKYEYFIKGKKVPPDYYALFMSDLTNDAYRMIVRKPLKKGKINKRKLFDSAHNAIKEYIRKGYIKPEYLSASKKFHIWLVSRGWYLPCYLFSKLT